MQRGLSLVELATKIEAQKALKADYLAPASELRMNVEDGKPLLHVPNVREFEVLPVAHDQIGDRTKIPARYYNRMLAEAPELLASNVNRWLSTDTDKRMIRTLDGSMRAFLSDRYNRVENEEIAEVALPVLMETAGIEVVAAEVTERRLYLMATTSRIQGEVATGDVVQAGVCITNSEVGLGSVEIRPLVYRLVCLNGMIMPDAKLSARHVGRRIGIGEDLNAMFTDETRRADDRALLLKVRDTIRFAMDEVMFKKTVDRFAETAEAKIENDPAKSVEILARKIGATELEGKSILRSLIKDGNLSAFGLINAVTYQAHDAEKFDRAVEFEQAAGQLLNLPRREWKEILEAA